MSRDTQTGFPGTYSIKAINVGELSPPMSKQSVVNKYSKLCSGLGKLQGEHKIHLKENATPFCLATPRRVPLPLMKKVKAEIDRMVDCGVIEPVNDPTDWCAPIIAVPKPSRAVRICVDLTKLNESVRQEYYIILKVETTLGSIAEGTVYSKLDANSGFHQIMLSDESAKLTTFVTPFGISSARSISRSVWTVNCQGSMESFIIWMTYLLSDATNVNMIRG